METIWSRARAAQSSNIGTCGDSGSLALWSSIQSAIFPFSNSLVGHCSSLSGPLFIHFLIVSCYQGVLNLLQSRHLNFPTDACKISAARILCHAVLCGDQETKGWRTVAAWYLNKMQISGRASDHQIQGLLQPHTFRQAWNGPRWIRGFIERSYRMTAKSHYLLIKYWLPQY